MAGHQGRTDPGARRIDPQHPHKRDLYVALADRWLPNLPPEVSAAVVSGMEAMAASGATMATAEEHDVPEGLSDLLDPNTSIADYVWLPVRFDGDMPVLDWHDEWRVEDFD